MRDRVVHAGFDAPSVDAALARPPWEKLDESFDADGMRLRVRLAGGRVAGMKARLRDGTRNRVRIDDNG